MDSNLEELKTQVASLSARVAMAEAQIAEMDDDFPEPAAAGIPQEAGDPSKWSGRAYLFYGDGGISPVDVEDDSEILGTHIVCYLGTSTTSSVIAPSGYTRIGSTRFSWHDGVSGAPWISWEVAEVVPDSSPTRYRAISGKTVGDIRVPLPIPASKYMVVQQGSDGSGDNGIVGQYPRTH